MQRSVAVAVLIAILSGGVASAATGDGEFRRAGVVVQVPTEWKLGGRVNRVIEPVTLFTASTFTIPKVSESGSSGGMCSRALQRGWRSAGAYVQLTEVRDGASRAKSLGRVPSRPAHFVLNAKGWGGLCTPADSGSLSFHAKGRVFQVVYGFGPKASKATRAQAAAMLDSMEIAAKP